MFRGATLIRRRRTGGISGGRGDRLCLALDMPWAVVTVPSPSKPTAPTPSGLSVGGSQVHSVSALAPALSLPGSLSPAGGLLLLFAALNFLMLSIEV